MAQESTKAWGGKRDNQTGRPVRIPVGEGERRKIFVTAGAELLDLLRAKYPGLNDQDLVRAVMWEAAGHPIHLHPN